LRLVAEAAVVGLLVFVAVGEGWMLTVMLLLLLLYTVVEAEAAEALVKSLLFFLQTLSVLAPRSGILSEAFGHFRRSTSTP
jgi:hypothetical protein